MAKKAIRGRYIEVRNVRVKSVGRNIELTFRVPYEAIREALPHIRRFVERMKKQHKNRPT